MAATKSIVLMPRPSPYRMTDEQLDRIAIVDWARLAAFIDGEGHIRMIRSASYAKSMIRNIQISNTDIRLVIWLKKIFGGYVYTWPSRNQKWKPLSDWIAPAGLADQLLEHCLPYLIIKREQAELFLSVGALVNSRGGRVKAEIASRRNVLLSEFQKQKAFQSERSRLTQVGRLN